MRSSTQGDSESFLEEAEKALEDVDRAKPEQRSVLARWKPGLIVVIVIAVVVAALLFIETSLTCERIETGRANCTIQSTWLGVVPLRDESVRDVQGAQVARVAGDSSYCLELETSTGIIPLTLQYSTRTADMEQMAASVRALLWDPNAALSLEIELRYDLSGLLVPAIVAGGLVLFLFTARLRFGSAKPGGSRRDSKWTRPSPW